MNAIEVASIVVPRNGITAMGHELEHQLGMTLFGRAASCCFDCHTGFERFDPEPRRSSPQGPKARDA